MRAVADLPAIAIPPAFRSPPWSVRLSVSAGVRGLRYTVGTRGTRTTVGLPGSGVSVTKAWSWQRRPPKLPNGAEVAPAKGITPQRRAPVAGWLPAEPPIPVWTWLLLAILAGLVIGLAG